MKTALADAQTNLQKAQERMKRAVDKRRWSEAYKVGDEVVLTTANLHSYCDTLVGPFGTLCGYQLSCQLLLWLRCLFWLRSGNSLIVNNDVHYIIIIMMLRL